MGTRVLTDKHGQPFTVRELMTADRAALHATYVDFQPKRAAQGLPPEHEAGLKRWLDHVLSHGHHLLVEVDGIVRGHLMLIPMDDGGAELAIYLHQSIRRRGIGTAMNKLAVALAGEIGYWRVWLSVEVNNVAAIRSYQKAGFKRTTATMWSHEIEMDVSTTALSR